MSVMVSSPILMVVALLFLNMTVVCLLNGNSYIPPSTTYHTTTEKKEPNSVNNFVIVLKEKQKQIKRMYQNLLSYLSIPFLSGTFVKLTRVVSKYHDYIVRLLALREEECTKTIYNFPVKYRSS